MDFVDKKSTNAFACERSGVYKGSTKANIDYKNKWKKKKDKWRLIERKICGCIFILKSANLSNDDNSILYVKCK